MALKNEIYVAALPIVDIDFYTAQDVLDAHLEKAEEVGTVYFSTSNRLNYKKAQKVSKVLLVSKAFTYIADLVDYAYFATKTTPLDAAYYAPGIFSNDEDHHWLKLTNIRQISFDELNSFQIVNKKLQAQYNGVGSYFKSTGRLQVFYAKKTL